MKFKSSVPKSVAVAWNVANESSSISDGIMTSVIDGATLSIETEVIYVVIPLSSSVTVRIKV